ncbi:HAD-IC family P-type ATPase [Elioraea sp.]|uniref:cation-translocating P-type ATPase n=1 Tax=Elioraea sp. TaxID=2185103 RepID=UPI0021DD9DF8|nr:HAD-IC family P-type ATPase [Elioraea sp.]GIX08927.1 MAG: cation-transporting P-type ATPase [Elioraea sp.]
MPHADAAPRWHALPAEEVCARLGTPPHGLDQAEAAARLARHGPNRLPEPARIGPLRRFLAQFQNVLIQVLLAAAAITALLGHWIDTAVIVAVVLINALVGFVQEGKAEAALEAVRRMLSPRATVIRDGHRHGIDAEAVVPGDLVVLEPGDRVPADLRIIAARGLAIQEAILTGESLPVAKSPAPVDPLAPLGDRSSLAFSGTVVAAGHGRGVVVATGGATEIGRISGMLAAVETLQTPLLRAIAAFGRTLSVAILLLAAATFAVGSLWRGLPADEMFLAAVGIAVAAIPEGLPAIITIILALGVRRMAGCNAIVRRLPAVEALGSVDVICTDKTGTLTRNELSVRALALPDGEAEIGGVGYVPEGDITRGGRAISAEDDAALAAMLRAAVLCNDARLHRDRGEWAIEGDPTDGAFLVLAEKAGIDASAIQRRWSRTDAIPFESDHKFMATLHHDHEGHGLIAVKGAPEVLLARCAAVDAAWQARLEALAERGYRLIAVAARPTAHDHLTLAFDDIRDLELLGVAALIDAAREEAIAAVAECRRAGIAVTMITGDHAGTATAIAREVGIEVAGGALTGAELDAMDDRALARAAERVRVFARTSPAHKLRLVQALQARRHVVAMTGDGVNDAPALKRADIGVAMGRSGTEAAKEAAGIVLADDNFATIAAAVREGRTIYDNLQKTLLFILPTNGGQAMTVVAAVVLGLAVLPITPVQILWVNLVVAVTLALALAFEPAEPDVMTRPPRMPDEPILSVLLVWRVALVSALLAAASIGAFLAEHGAGEPVETARGAAVTALIAGQAAYLFNARFFRRSGLSLDALTGNRAVLVAIGLIILLQGLFLYAPPMQALFTVAPPDLSGWLLTLAAAVVVFGVVEIEKALMRRAPATPSARRPPAAGSR